MLKHQTYMNIAKECAKESKCAAKQVACILVKGDNIISIGINGTAPGSINCNEKFKKVNGTWYTGNKEVQYICSENEHHEWSLKNEFHAELNALSHANSNGTSTVGSTAYITFSPCSNCAKMLVAFGITRVVFEECYDDFADVQSFLIDKDVEVIKVKNGDVSCYF